MLKEIKKGIIIGLSFSLTVFGAVYAANKISYTETAVSGDIITADYFNSIKNILPIDSTKIDNTSVQQRVSGNCSEGSSIRSINSDGTVICEIDNGGLSSVTSTEIVDNTITENDISDSFKARDADKLDGVDGNDYALKTYVDGKVSSSSGLGIGQSWQDVTSIRKSGVTYKNTTGKPIEISFTNNYNNDIYINGIKVAMVATANSFHSNTFVIPNNHTYRITGTFGTTYYKWSELR